MKSNPSAVELVAELKMHVERQQAVISELMRTLERIVSLSADHASILDACSSRHPELVAMIMKARNNRPMSVKEIAAATGLNAGSVRGVLYGAYRNHFVADRKSPRKIVWSIAKGGGE